MSLPFGISWGPIGIGVSDSYQRGGRESPNYKGPCQMVSAFLLHQFALHRHMYLSDEIFQRPNQIVSKPIAGILHTFMWHWHVYCSLRGSYIAVLFSRVSQFSCGVRINSFAEKFCLIHCIETFSLSLFWVF